jgi:hypothetical protein
MRWSAFLGFVVGVLALVVARPACAAITGLTRVASALRAPNFVTAASSVGTRLGTGRSVQSGYATVARHNLSKRGTDEA